MDAENVVLLGVKNTVIAFHKGTGQRLWSTQLKSGFRSDFISILADATQVYAHTSGEMFCLNLANGELLWSDGLAGYGYGLASIAVPGQPAATAATVAAIKKKQQDAAAAAHAPPITSA